MNVATIQRALAAASVSMDPGPIDGIRGRKTIAAIEAFQRAHGLTVDGVVGPITTAALRYYLTTPAEPDQPGEAPAGAYLPGVDLSGFPGLERMAELRRSGLAWTGFYLGPSPSHRGADWMAHRQALVDQGWGLAPIYVGQQTIGPGSHTVTAQQGRIDGTHTAALMQNAGFKAGRYVFLDIENGRPFTAAQRDYVTAWAIGVKADGYRPGVYCSHTFADEVQAIDPDIRIWAFRVPTTQKTHWAGPWEAPDPADSGCKSAVMWQRRQNVVLSDHGGLLVDLNTSRVPDPSA